MLIKLCKMNKLVVSFIVVLLLVGCNAKQDDKQALEKKVTFNPTLAEELKKMAEIDQIAAFIPQGEYEKMTEEEWKSFKDSVFTSHQKRLKQLFDEHGFAGFDLVGEEGSQNFWLMVQHSDHNPSFQQEVLEKMKIEVENKNAKPSNYGLLVDRVNLNMGKSQIYGTQVSYNLEIAQAFPKNLADSATVNERRKSIGLEPIEQYLNDMSTANFQMNKEYYLQKGITGPTLYELPPK